MKKMSSYISIILGSIGFFLLAHPVSAATPSYSFGFEAYNVSEACNIETEDGAWDCWASYVLGDLSDYKIVDNKITKKAKIMVVLKAEALENSDIGVLKLSIPVDTTKVTPYNYSIYNTDTTREDWGIYPAVRQGTKYITNWQPSMSFNSNKQMWTFNTADDKLGMSDFKPLVTPGALAAMFYEVNEDISPGANVEFKYHYVANDDPSASHEEKQLVTISNAAYEEEKQYGTYNSLVLSMASSSSNINTLSSLTATGNNGLSYEFGFVASSKDDMEYSFIVPYTVDNIKFSGTPTDSTIKGATGLVNIVPAPTESNPNPTIDTTGHNLNVGENTINILVTSASGSIANYKIKATRLSNDTRLTSVTGTNSVNFTPNSDGFMNTDEASNTITIPYNISSTDITAGLNDTNATIDPALGTWNINSNHNTETKNTYTIHVKAEDCKYTDTEVPGNTCTEATYNFAIKRSAPSKDVTLSSLKVEDVTGTPNELLNEANPTTDTFNITVEPNTTKVKVTANVTDAKSTVTYQNANANGEANLNVGNNTIIAKVTSEAGANGITKEYTINIYRKSNENKLSSLTITTNPAGVWSTPFNPTLDKTQGVYTYTIEPTVTDITVTATALDTGKSSVTILDMSSSETEDDTGKVLNTDTKTFNNTVTKIGVIVTAENGDKRTYIVDVKRNKSNDNTLKSLSINPGTLKETFQSTKKNYTAEVEANVESVSVTAVLNDALHAKIVEITGADNLSVGSNTIEIKTQAENGSETSYVITVTRKAYDIQTLDEIKVGYDSDPTTKITGFDKDTFNYNLNTKTTPISYATNAINIEYIKSHETVNVSGDTGLINLSSFAGKTLVDDGSGKKVYEYKFNINTRSQAGNTKKYVLTLYREANSDKNINTITVHGVGATVDPTSDNIYHVELENNFETVGRNDIAITPSVTTSLVTKVTDNLNLSTTANNIFNFNITAENGEVKNYEIHITRKKSNDNNIRRVYLKLPGETTITSETRYCVFTGSDTTCKINVPSITTGYTLEAEVADTATPNYIDGPVYTMSSASTDSTQIRTIEVTAENNDKKTYTITVERAASSNNYLGTLKTNANSETLEEINGFNTVNPSYNLTVPATQTSIRIYAESQVQSANITSPDYTGVVGSSIDFTKNLDFGLNTITLTVKAEDQSPKIYTINVTRSANTEPRLSEITINGRPINEFLTDMTFDNDVTKPVTDTVKEYTLNDFEYAISSITIGATSVDTEHGTIRNNDLGLKNIKTIHSDSPSTEYVNTFTIRSYAHDTSVYCDYIIHVKRAANNDTSIKNVGINYDGSVHLATFDSNENVYKITVPNKVGIVDSSNVVVSVGDPLTENDPKSTVSMGVTNLVTDDATNKNVNTHKFTVRAEDGTEKEYTMLITRELSDNALLSGIRVLDGETSANVGSFNPSFNPETGIYNVSVPVSTNTVTIEVDKGESHQTITGILPSYTLTDSKATVNITVTAEDNITPKSYTLNIRREASSNNALKEIIVTDESGDTYTVTKDSTITNRYNVTIPGSISKVTLKAIPESPLATPSYNGADVDTESTYTIESAGAHSKEIIISSESGSQASYILVITKEQKNDATLKTLRYRYKETEEYTNIDLASGTTESDGSITFTLPNVENAISKIYIDAEANDAPDAIITSGIGETALSVLENTINIVVRAQNGDTLTYKIKVNRAKSSNAFLQMLSVVDYTFQEQPVDLKNNFDYTIRVNETKETLNKSEITAKAEDGNAKVVFQSDSINLSTTDENIMTITVIAEDNTEQNYNIKVIRPKSTDATLKSVDLNNTGTLSPSITPNNRNYTITVPYGQETFEIRGIPNVSTSKVIRGDNVYTVADTTSVELEVEPEDKTVGTEIYTFNVVIAPSNVASLSSLSVSGYPFKDGNTIIPFTQGKRDYSIGDIKRSVDKILVNATPTNAASKVQYYKDGTEITTCTGLTSCEITLEQIIGAKQIRVLVTAADNVTTLDYTIDYNKVYSNNNLLENMEIFNQDNTKLTTNEAWNETTTSYTLNVPNEIDTIRLDLTAKEAQSLIKVNGDSGDYHTYTKNISLSEGTNTINISVVAEDNSEKPYTLVITRASSVGSTDAYLSGLTILDGENTTTEYPLTPGFSMNEENYSIGEIPFATKKLKINLTKNEGHSTEKYFINGTETPLDSEGNLPILDENSTITIQMTAEDGHTKKSYNITYTKNPSSNAHLKNIIVNKSVLKPTFENNVFLYTVELPSEEDSIDITAILEDPKSKITMNGESYISGSTKTLSNLEFGNTSVKYVVTAEDGTVLTYEVVITRLSENEMITSEQYGHTIEDGYIKTVSDNKTVLDMKNELDNDNEKLVIYESDGTTELSDTDLVGTDKIVKLIVDGKELDSKIIIVLGDVNGDGSIDTWDDADILSHYVGLINLTGAKLLAADINLDGEVDTWDDADVLSHYVGLKNIHERSE